MASSLPLPKAGRWIAVLLVIAALDSPPFSATHTAATPTLARGIHNLCPTSAFCLRGGGKGALAAIELRDVPLTFSQGSSSPLFLPLGYEDTRGKKAR